MSLPTLEEGKNIVSLDNALSCPVHAESPAPAGSEVLPGQCFVLVRELLQAGPCLGEWEWGAG